MERAAAAPGGRGRARRDAGARHGGSCCWPRPRRKWPVREVAPVRRRCQAVCPWSSRRLSPHVRSPGL